MKGDASVGLASSSSPPPALPDQRNLQWKSNNIGAKLLGKMGWKDGQAVGKRQRVTTANTANKLDSDVGLAGKDGVPSCSSKGHVSSEGLRIAKRAEGLGVGAERTRQASIHGSTDVFQDFATVLARLNSQCSSDRGDGGGDDDDGDSGGSSRQERRGKERKSMQSKKESSKSISLPTNKTTCHKVRRAKFQEKTEEDMKCIFGSKSVVFPAAMVVVSDQSSSSAGGGGCGSERKKKSKRKTLDNEDKRREKKEKKQK
jgi:hypothetical protein